MILCDNCAQAYFKIRFIQWSKRKQTVMECPVCGQRHTFNKKGEWQSRYYGMIFGETDRFIFPKLLKQELQL